MSNIVPRELISVDKSKEIRFLTIVSTLTRGGTERAAVNYALGYHRAGFPSAVLAYGGGGPRQKMLEEAGIPVFIGGENPVSLNRAIGCAKAWSPDILHLNRSGITDSPSASVIRTLIHPRLRIFETNVFGYVDRSPDRVLIDLHLLLSRWCLWKWTQSAQGLLPKSSAVVVPNPVDSNSFIPANTEMRTDYRKMFGIPPDAFVFGRVGNPWSGWSPALIHAFETIAQVQSNVWLVVCGLSKSLQPFITKLPKGIRARIIELPRTDSDEDLRQYYGLMDVFVHASKIGESFGMVLCEAMLSGIPVITIATPLRNNSQIEVVSHGKAGLVVQNQKQMINAMIMIQKDFKGLELMKRSAREWIIEKYDVPVVSHMLVKLAIVTLASDSSQNLAMRLAANPEICSSAPPNLFCDIYKSAGLRLSLFDRILTSLINRPMSRRVISIVHAIKSRMR